MKRELIYDIIRLALSSERVVDYIAFERASAMEWQWVFNMMSMHGLAAFIYDAVEKMPEEIKPPKDIILKFISANMLAQRGYDRLKELAEKISEMLKVNDVKCLLLKGLSLAEYYPRPESRKFLDIDLYAPDAETIVDAAFAAKGVNVDTDFYRHSHIHLNGLLVENHHCLLDVRGRKRLALLDTDLKAMALDHLASFDGPGLYFPDVRFSAVFNLHHAMSHFIYEGISFKFLVDWILFFRKEKEAIYSEQMKESLDKHRLLKFAGVMTSVSVHHLGLSETEVPEYLKDAMKMISPKVEARFIEDLFRSYEQVHQKNIVLERLNCVRRIIKASWKPKEFLGQNAVAFVWDKFVPILLGKKFEAD